MCSSLTMSLFGGGSSFGQSNVFGNTATAANTNPMKDFEVRVLHWLQFSTGSVYISAVDTPDVLLLLFIRLSIKKEEKKLTLELEVGSYMQALIITFTL